MLTLTSHFYCLGGNKNCPINAEFAKKIKEQTFKKTLRNEQVLELRVELLLHQDEKNHLNVQLENSYIKGNKLVVDKRIFITEDLMEQEQQSNETLPMRKENSTLNSYSVTNKRH